MTSNLAGVGLGVADEGDLFRLAEEGVAASSEELWTSAPSRRGWFRTG